MKENQLDDIHPNYNQPYGSMLYMAQLKKRMDLQKEFHIRKLTELKAKQLQEEAYAEQQYIN